MPTNLYTDFNNGTWEVFPNDEFRTTDYYTPSDPSPYPAILKRSNVAFKTGAYSGRIQYLRREQPTSTKIQAGVFKVQLLNPSINGLLYPFTLGRKYKLSVWVFVPSVNPIGSDNLPLVIAPLNWNVDAPTFWSTAVLVKKTVLEAKDTWVQLSIEFIANAPPYGVAFSIFGYSLDSESVSVLTQADAGFKSKVTAAGTPNINGLMYIDDIFLEEVFPCDIVAGDPAYTKTDESVSGANDGSVHLIATSSYFIQASLDNITFQSSLDFNSLAPGPYTAYLKDTNGCSITIPFTINSGPPEPSCTLIITGYSKTNETAPNAGDGTITAIATSDYPIEVSIDTVNWFPGLTVTNVIPGVRTLYIRDSDPLVDCGDFITGIIISEFGAVITGSMEGNWLNRYNFIQWREFSGTTNFNTLDCNCEVLKRQLPNPYRLRDWNFTFEKNERHYPVICPNEIFTFYFNLIGGIVDPEFSDYKIGIANSTGMLQSSIGTLKKVDIDMTHYNVYSDDLQVNALPRGLYFLVIYKGTELLYASNDIQLLTKVDTNPYFNAEYVTLRAQYRNSNNLYGYLFESIPDFAIKIRLKLYEIDTQTDGTLEQYRSVSTGEMRNTNFELNKFSILEMYYADDIGQDAMFVWQANNLIVLNEKLYIVKSLYKVAWDQRMKVNKGTIEMYEQEFSTSNRYGNPGGITPDPEGSLLASEEGTFIRI